MLATLQNTLWRRTRSLIKPNPVTRLAIKVHQKRNYAKLPPFDYTPKKYSGPSREEIMQLRNKYLNPGIFLYYKRPVVIVEGKMQYLFDEEGRRYLDAIGGIVTISVGHCHPYVTKVAKQQMETLQHSTTIYLNPNIVEFAKALADKMPGNLKVCYFVNSGSEANDLAILMARLYTGNYDVIALRNGYHGMSPSSMGLTAHSTWKFPIAQGFGIHHAINPDGYRGPFKYDDPDMAKKYALDVKNLIDHGTTGSPAAFIAEPIQGVGGTVVLPDGYLKQVYGFVREKGGVCISDEVQTGFARMGTDYWGFQTMGVIPDIVTMAKGIGNGFPLAAVVTTPEIANVLSQKIHFNTFGGNPVASAIGKAVLEVIDKEYIQRNALEQGQLLKEGLLNLQKKHHIIGDVRGKGLMLGIELVRNKATRDPAPDFAAAVLEETKDNSVLIGKGGYYGNVLRIKPPMCINQADIEFLVDTLDKAFHKIS